MQQVVLAQLLQAVGQLLHVDGLVAAGLLLGMVLAAHAVGVGGARIGEEGEELRLGVAEGLSVLGVAFWSEKYRGADVRLGAWPRSARTGS